MTAVKDSALTPMANSLTTYLRALPRFTTLTLLIAACGLLASLLLKPVMLPQTVYQLQVTFDISQSMGVMDGLPGDTSRNRLTHAKSSARELLGELPCGSSIGWSIFTGKRVVNLITPLDVCEHYAALLLSLDGVDGRMRWENASSVGKGLHQSIRTANTLGNDTAVLFMTDGHEAPPLSEGQTGLPKTDGFDVTGVLVGVGGDTPMPIPKVDALGRVIGEWQAQDVVQRQGDQAAASQEERSALHEDHLVRLARLANFGYVRLTSTRALLEAVREYAPAARVSAPRDIRWLPACVALLLIVWRLWPWQRKRA